MQFLEIVCILSLLVAAGVVVFCSARHIGRLCLITFVATNTLVLLASVTAEAVFNDRPPYAWRAGSQTIDGALRGLGAFLMFFPMIQGTVFLGIVIVAVGALVKRWLLRNGRELVMPEHTKGAIQLSLWWLIGAVYMTAVLAWLSVAMFHLYDR